ncbi:MAG: leucine-rich repeat domain-containing protein, partial [Lachnospiraceae bacterium]|nr:leucine-rich repeat domain-containing protein [Lachnospiraceae bacterium]
TTAPPEDPPQQEDVLPEETEDELDTRDDVTTALPEDPSQQEDVLPEETLDGSDTSDDISPALQETLSQQEDALLEEIPDRLTTRDSTIPTPAEAYEAMIALKDKDGYKEGTTWTNEEPYSDARGYYHWKGGILDGKNISGVGCVAFAFILSDEAFGSLPARMYAEGEFSFEDIKVGDILRVNNDIHTVIVLEVSDVGVVVAEGNISTGDYRGKVHWGRGISKEEVMSNTSHYITRYPEGYVPPDDPEANESIAAGSLDGSLAWNLTKAGTLTISGRGAMPDFNSTADQPWNDNGSQIRKVVIGDGVTSIGSCAFWNCGVTSVEISSSVTTIGNSAFRGSPIISVTIPSNVETIGDSAFRECQNLSSMTVCEGVGTIDQNAFRACTSLTSITMPASIGEVGNAAFFECTAMRSVTFASGNKQVKLGDNMFTRCYCLMNVTLPQYIDCIGTGMFQNCIMLAGVEIPQGAERIGESAFASCSSLTTVIIPDSVTTIGTAAFSACSLEDIYFTGTEAQWNHISKIGDTASAVSKATIHYNYTPVPSPTPNPDESDDNDNNTGDNSGGDKPGNPSSGNNPGSSSSDNASNNTGSNSDKAKSNPEASSIINSGIKTVVETWKPATPDEIRRYACMGKEAVQYTLSKDNAYQIAIDNAMQGPMCFKSFEAILGDYTIGRTYNIYSLSDTAYSMDKEIQFTIEIPSAIYKEDREYRMICVTKDGQPIIYNDTDNNPETITIKTNKFYAYALIYKQKQNDGDL